MVDHTCSLIWRGFDFAEYSGSLGCWLLVWLSFSFGIDGSYRPTQSSSSCLPFHYLERGHSLICPGHFQDHSFASSSSCACRRHLASCGVSSFSFVVTGLCRVLQRFASFSWPAVLLCPQVLVQVLVQVQAQVQAQVLEPVQARWRQCRHHCLLRGYHGFLPCYHHCYLHCFLHCYHHHCCDSQHLNEFEV